MSVAIETNISVEYNVKKQLKTACMCYAFRN